MNITAYGAANEVTGSCYLLESADVRLLIDCGLFQGSERLERQNIMPKNILSKKLDAAFLTHGHLDHCGRLPLLVKSGYRGPIYATEPTLEITRLILSDSAKIQEDDIRRENRRREERGLEPLSPLFDMSDVEDTCKLFRPITYNEAFTLSDGVEVQYVDAGHILGSANIELSINNNGAKQKLVFSGDLGPFNAPIMQDPSHIDGASIVFMESTYGDRDHQPLADTVREFQDLVKAAVAKKGKVFIPVFAVGRAQLILYYLAEMFRDGIVPPMPIFLDSPMAIAATELYDKYPSFMDSEAQNLHSSGQLSHDLQTLKLCSTVEESKAINTVEGPIVVLAGAGMCNAGRILHHLRHNLGNSDTYVLIVGYQAKGSLGRMLVEGEKQVKIYGETINVRATVKGLGGFSAHSGQSDLLKWLAPMAEHRPRVFLVHGEPQSITQLAYKVEQTFGLKAEVPRQGEAVTV